MDSWGVYILRSKKDGKRYIGCTNDLPHRLKEHNSGKVYATRWRTPFEVVHSESYQDRAVAFAREKLLKSYKGGNALKRLLGQ